MPNLNPRFTAGVVVWLIGSLNVAWIYSYSEKKLLKMEDGSPSRGESSRSVVAQETTIQMDGLMPQLFTSMPSLNEAASLLAQTTSYFTGCFSDFSVEPSPRERQSLLDGQELQTFPSGQNARHLVRDHLSASELSSSSSATSPFPDTMTRRTSADTSQTTTAIVASSSGGNGISLFQGLVERARRTVRGSADDIGWLKRDPGLPPAEDGTERFMTILDNIRHGVHQLPSSIVYLLVPGLFSNHGPMYFVNTKSKFSKMGLTCHIARIHSESSVEKNAREIKDYIEEIYWGSNKRVMLLGHSKGGIDSAAALSLYWPELKDKVAGLVIAQSPYGGTPVASDILREGQLGDYVSLRKLMEIVICKVIKGDMQALEDLTYDKRKEFLRKHELPRELAVVSFHTEAGITPAVIATLSHVAHAELPSVVSSEAPTKLPVVIPLGAAMAACAQLIQIRYGEKSDGLVTRCDAEVPGSLAVRPTRKLDHAWMVYSSLKDDTAEANAAEVCEALLTLLVEKERREGDGEKQD